MRTRRLIMLTALLAALPLAGCDDAEVRTYTVAKDDRPQRPEPITWDVPDGWVAYPEAGGMRYATIYSGKGDGHLEVAVTYLSGEAGGVVANINRWRGQIGLGPATPQDAADEMQPIQIGTREGVLLDMTGPNDDPQLGSKPRMLAAMISDGLRMWFFKATGPVDVVEKHKPAFVQMVQSVRFPSLEAAHAHAPQANAPTTDAAQDAPAAPQPAPQADGGLRYDTPEGWRAGAQTAFAMATFDFGAPGSPDAPGAAGRVTISRLGGEGGGVLPNINRWRGQVGLPGVADLEQSGAEGVIIGGKRGVWVDAVKPDAGPNDPRITGAIIPDAGFTWFIKMTGPNAAVAEQQAAFRQFVKSLHWPG